MNKVKYGLKNVHYAKCTIGTNGAATYGTPVAFPGAVNLSLDAKGDSSVFYADDVAYAQFAANAGYEGTFEAALIPDSFKADILGEVVDSNGVYNEVTGAPAQPFALLFEFNGDENATRFAMYNCVASRPSVSGQTVEESVEAQTETLNLTCASVYNEALGKDVVKARLTKSSTSATAYSSWFTSVYQSAQ